MSYMALITALLLFTDHQDESQVTSEVLASNCQLYCQHAGTSNKVDREFKVTSYDLHDFDYRSSTIFPPPE